MNYGSAQRGTTFGRRRNAVTFFANFKENKITQQARYNVGFKTLMFNKIPLNHTPSSGVFEWSKCSE